ncbi:cytochrome C [Maritimibacter sp. 55A14]|uniref:c-type cytochrome n=1 Tax=Maritimibacter sp. 55A14 TaxID=2174844 RepID=UPI000D621C3B|nr:cytochrome c [Maritimibacter sp. 55A14]PWE30483.1 cytochrome C [Maritimibacter sp. 55A14]
MTWRFWFAMAVSAGAVACAPARPTPEVGRATYQANCTGCHGAGGQGDGTVAGLVFGGAPDLTRLSARNGGTFPDARVMSVIDGYTRRQQHGGVMPEFGPLLEGRKVLWRAPDGTLTPTPVKLVALAEYLQTIQVTED